MISRRDLLKAGFALGVSGLLLPDAMGQVIRGHHGGTLISVASTSYFGACDINGSVTGESYTDSYGEMHLNQSTVWTCPGTGSKTIVEMSALVYINAGTGVIRLAIYTSTGTTKIAEGTANVTVTGASGSWQGHMTQAAISPNPATLTGGTAYLICLWTGSSNSNKPNFGYGSGAYDAGSIHTVDYSAGFPASLPAAVNWGYIPMVRVGVQ